MNTAKILKLLTIASTALAAFAAGLGTFQSTPKHLRCLPSGVLTLMGTAFLPRPCGLSFCQCWTL